MNRLLERCEDLRAAGWLPVPVRPLTWVANGRGDHAALTAGNELHVDGIRPPELRVETRRRRTNGRARCRRRNEVEPHGRRDVADAIPAAVLGHERRGGAADPFLVPSRGAGKNARPSPGGVWWSAR